MSIGTKSVETKTVETCLQDLDLALNRDKHLSCDEKYRLWMKANKCAGVENPKQLLCVAIDLFEEKKKIFTSPDLSAEEKKQRWIAYHSKKAPQHPLDSVTYDPEAENQKKEELVSEMKRVYHV